MPTKKRVADGLYQDPVSGTFHIRPWIGGVRTWRALKAQTLKYAKEEAAALHTDHARSKVGQAVNPFAGAGSFQEMASLYLAAGCPNRRLETRGPMFCANEKDRIANLNLFFGRMPMHDIKLVLLPKYKAWRVKRCERGTGGDRTVDLDLVTLSNVLSYAVATGQLEYNYIRNGRPRFRKSADVRRSREVAPKDGDVIHRIATHFLQAHNGQSQAVGWLFLFAVMSGCRKKELLALRMDARTQDEPGYIDGNYLFIRRGKGGINPFILISDEFAAMLSCFQNWHQQRYPENPWFFPGRVGSCSRLTKDALHQALSRLKKDGYPHITPHGCRSFYVTKRRGDGLSDPQVAAEIGDKTVSVLAQSYGDVPQNWIGNNKLSFLPKEGFPAWSILAPESKKVVGL